MALCLKVRHLARYQEIGTLLLKHGRADGLHDFDPGDPTTDDAATDDDARRLADEFESMGPTFTNCSTATWIRSWSTASCTSTRTQGTCC